MTTYEGLLGVETPSRAEVTCTPSPTSVGHSIVPRVLADSRYRVPQEAVGTRDEELRHERHGTPDLVQRYRSERLRFGFARGLRDVW